MKELLEQLREEAVKWRRAACNSATAAQDLYAIGKAHGLEIAIHELEKVIQQQNALGK